MNSKVIIQTKSIMHHNAKNIDLEIDEGKYYVNSI